MSPRAQFVALFVLAPALVLAALGVALVIGLAVIDRSEREICLSVSPEGWCTASAWRCV